MLNPKEINKLVDRLSSPYVLVGDMISMIRVEK